MEQAHDSIVWSLSWHPLGHILSSGSNDHSWYDYLFKKKIMIIYLYFNI